MIKASEVKADSIRGIISELEDGYMGECYKIATARGWAIGDAIEAIATHIYYTGEDYNDAV